MSHTVGAAAKAVGVSVKAIRLWEAKGLLPSAERTEAGYRLFTEADIKILDFIRRAKTLGLTLSEIKNILELQRQGAVPCQRVTELLDAHIRDINRTIADLRALRATLASVRQSARDDQRRGETATICRIIETATDSADSRNAQA
ncbi:MerR family transcriptional regulator [Mycobacterium gordonae]|uniref:MerR family transcriptional regulator n=1 Tax=Mycobacterium gordonae TaxID=1778 RepID=A0A0Q2M8L9_MYCGO|nr:MULTISPECIES: heavy metal-responsive transcriptional regulator [Mycobacterium]KQH76231.1 MerR family transcriptional regulator [Mycobacterium gordonae]MDP7732837.1 heavy metal-responsive transcriptional regulator [Mycobacterium sp. TY813]